MDQLILDALNVELDDLTSFNLGTTNFLLSRGSSKTLKNEVAKPPLRVGKEIIHASSVVSNMSEAIGDMSKAVGGIAAGGNKGEADSSKSEKNLLSDSSPKSLEQNSISTAIVVSSTISMEKNDDGGIPPPPVSNNSPTPSPARKRKFRLGGNNNNSSSTSSYYKFFITGKSQTIIHKNINFVIASLLKPDSKLYIEFRKHVIQSRSKTSLVANLELPSPKLIHKFDANTSLVLRYEYVTGKVDTLTEVLEVFRVEVVVEVVNSSSSGGEKTEGINPLEKLLLGINESQPAPANLADSNGRSKKMPPQPSPDSGEGSVEDVELFGSEKNVGIYKPLVNSPLAIDDHDHQPVSAKSANFDDINNVKSPHLHDSSGTLHPASSNSADIHNTNSKNRAP